MSSVTSEKPPSTTLKLDNFLSKPLRDTTLSNVQGVGPVTLAKLKSASGKSDPLSQCRDKDGLL